MRHAVAAVGYAAAYGYYAQVSDIVDETEFLDTGDLLTTKFGRATGEPPMCMCRGWQHPPSASAGNPCRISPGKMELFQVGVLLGRLGAQNTSL
jgi:hypothetical protein